MKKILLLVFASAISWSLFGQITTSTFSGRVYDQDKQGVIGAGVELIHLPSGTSYGTVSNADGLFTLAGVRVGGPYRLTTSYLGYDNSVIDGLFASLGENKYVRVDMVESGVVMDELVIAVNRNDAFSSKRTGSSTNLSSERIQSLPTISRSINDFTQLTPQSNGNSFAGTSSRFNNYMVDGSIYNNNFGLGSAQFAGGNPISLDAIEEVSVNLAPFDVRYSGFTGAAVNAVTKSGTNELSGSAYHLFRNDQMLGNRAGDITVDRGNSSNEIWGARLGGALIKNKLFFFASYEIENTSNPGLLKTAAREGETPDGITISRVPLSEANFVRDEMQRLYGYDTGAPDSYDFASEQTRLNLRLDYNISKVHKLALRYNRYSSFTDIPTNNNSIRFISTRFRNTTRQGVENINFRNNNYTNDRTVSSYVAELNSIFSNNITNQFTVGYTSVTDPKRGIPGDQAFPFIEVLEPDASGNPLYYMSMGNELFSVGNLLENNVLNITNNTTLYRGRHTYTAGVNFEYMTFDNAFNPVFNGFYRFNSYDSFVSAVIDQDPNVYPDAFAKSFAIDGSTTPPTDQTRFGQLGLYVQDEWQVSEQLRLTGGLRIDLPFYPIDLPANELLDAEDKTFVGRNGNEFIPDVSVLPKINPLFSPRVGFNYALDEDRNTVLRGGTGLFSGRIPFVWLSNQVNGSGVVRGGIGYEGQEVVDAGITFNPDVAAYNPENPAATLSNELNLTDRNFRLPQVWRTNLAVDHKLPFGIVGSLEFLYNRDVYTPIAYNSVLREPDGILSGPDERPFWITQPGLPGYSNDADFRNVFQLTNAGQAADYYALTVQLSKQFDSGFYAMAAFTRSRARDLDASGGSQAVSLWPATVQTDRNDPNISFAGFDQPNRLIANVAYTTKNTTIGVFYEGSHAGRFSYTYSEDFGDNANRLIYVPNDASELNFQEITIDGQTFDAAAQADILDAYIDQDDYLSGKRGEVVDRNGALLPWFNRFNLRILQDIPLASTGGHKLQLSLDFTNIGNLFNSDWGVASQVWQRNLLSLEEINDQNEPVYSLNTIGGTQDFPTTTTRFSEEILNNVWRMQMGIRYEF